MLLAILVAGNFYSKCMKNNLHKFTKKFSKLPTLTHRTNLYIKLALKDYPLLTALSLIGFIPWTNPRFINADLFATLTPLSLPD